MASIVGFSHYEHAIDEAAGLPNLDARQQELCRERYRRIDRFILLAVLGAAECARGHELAPDCGLYISTALGPLDSNVHVQEQMVRSRQLPKPFHFVNTLGSAVGYYVARNLQISGHSTFVSRRGGAFVSALALALSDLECGAVRQAIVGAVEECPLPLADHRAHRGLPAGEPVAEGSTWLLLERDSPATQMARLELERFEGWSESVARARTLSAHDTNLALGAGIEPNERETWLAQVGARAVDDEPVLHESRDGALIGRHVSTRRYGSLLLVAGRGRTLVHVTAR